MEVLEKINENIYKLPKGAYFDDDDILRDAKGEKLPDELYRCEDGSLISYEGNFLNMPLD